MAGMVLDTRDEKGIDSWHLPSRACKDLLKRSRYTDSRVLTPFVAVLEDAPGTQWKNESVGKGENSYSNLSCVLD